MGEEGEHPGEFGASEEGGMGTFLCPALWGQDCCAWDRSLELGHGRGRGSPAWPCRGVLTVPVPAPLLPPHPRAPGTSKDGAGQAAPQQENASCSPCPHQGQTSPCTGEQVSCMPSCQGHRDAPEPGQSHVHAWPRCGPGLCQVRCCDSSPPLLSPGLVALSPAPRPS